MIIKRSLYIHLCLILAVAVSANSTYGQSIRVNEAASTNVSFQDEDGDTPDWFELYNYGSEIINLNGWSISDNPEDTLKWIFPDLNLVPDQYMIVWASNKDRNFIGYSKTLVSPFDLVHYILPTSPVDQTWNQSGYDDSSWNVGKTSIGYGDDDDSTIVAQGTLAIFLRKEFEVTDLSSLAELILDIDYDDAFVAYLNGVEIARSGINGSPPSYNQQPNIGHEANLYRGIPLERFVIQDPTSILTIGTNVLSIQAHNLSGSSSDLTILPILSALYTSPSSDGVTPPDFVGLSDYYLHTNFKISSEGETIYLYDHSSILVDSIALPALSSEITAGRIDNDTYTYLFDEPTPGQANSSSVYLGKVENTVNFSSDGGVTTPLVLELTGNNQDEEIYFTLDGSLPTLNSTIYTAPININSTKIVKARIFKSEYLPSAIHTRSYLIGVNHNLPVVSLTFDHGDFFDPIDGIYVLGEGYSGNIPYFGSNIWEEWERPVNFSFYDQDGTLGISQDMGAKIFGGWSRSNEQRSISLFARSGYGKNSLDYPLFNSLDYSSFQAMVLRNSGNDWLVTNMNDALITSLMDGSGVEHQAFQPVATYFNGSYWGLYNIREKINEHFLASKSGVDPEEIDLLEFGGDVVQGSNLEYLELMAFLQSNSLALDNNYEYVKSKIDIDNYLSYVAVQIYAANTDWPGNNIKFWNHKNGKWRWILYDTDFGLGTYSNNSHNTLAFALEPNGPGWPNPPWSTSLLRNLVKSEEFRIDLINRFADYLNSRFKEDHVIEQIDSIRAIIQPEMPNHLDRWGGDYNWWFNNIQQRKSFASQRPNILRNHIREEFGLSNIVNVQIENLQSTNGIVQINSLVVEETFWSGRYFTDVPIKVKAIAKDGYRFSYWSGGVNSQSAELDLTLSQSMILKPHFEAITSDPEAIVINEINYNSNINKPTADWIELYNPNPFALTLSNWVFKDSDDLNSFILPELQDISANGYLVICRDLDAFSSQYPEIDNILGNFDFGLSSAGDKIRIFNAAGALIDEVEYLPSSPWPTQPDGSGATLELISPELDNALPENWASINAFGSPGQSNSITTNINEGAIQDNLELYPNPVTDWLYLNSWDKQLGHSTVQILDLRGVIKHQEKLADSDNSIDLSFLPHGAYLVRIISDGTKVVSRKIIKH